MLKKILAAMLALLAAVAFAAVDVNKATQTDLQTIKGIGPAISAKIVDERSKAPFKDWQDMIDRVKGVGEHNAATFSTEGLTVNGAAFSGAPARAAKTEATTTSRSKAETKATTAPATAAPTVATRPAPATATAAATATTAAPAAAPATTTAAKPMTKAEKKAAAKAAKQEKKANAAKGGSAAASAAAK